MKEMSYVFLFTFFPMSLIFTQVAASISYFLTATTKFHVVPLTKNVPFVFFFLTVALFLVELRWPGVVIRFPAKITPHLAPAYMKWVYGRLPFVRYVTTKFSRMDSLTNFLTHGAPLKKRQNLKRHYWDHMHRHKVLIRDPYQVRTRAVKQVLPWKYVLCLVSMRLWLLWILRRTCLKTSVALIIPTSLFNCWFSVSRHSK